LVHPDKCKDPRATEAFKLLTNAFEHLCSNANQEELIHNTVAPKKRQEPQYHYKERYTKRTRTEEEEAYYQQRQKQQEDKKKHNQYHYKYDSEESGNSKPAEEPDVTVSCEVCQRRFPNKDALNRHIKFSGANHRFPSKKKPTKENKIWDDL
jgi:hypothetical protein